ncbi:MAG: filamentous hemagglutinin N-terminal domain-containing protein [Nitrospira sp.]
MISAVTGLTFTSSRSSKAACITGALLFAIGFHTAVGSAQVPTAPITASGLKTHISDPITVDEKTQYNITGGTRAGTNLFHSFWNFDVPNSNIANFLNDTGLATDNVLGRVTSGNVSNIYGTIQTTGFGNANLFLMNPSGIVFGPTASLNVGGSVTFTTADYLRLDKIGGSNAGIFYADLARPSLLSSAPVDAYGFLRVNPDAIAIQGSQLKVSEGKGISIIGGDIVIQSGTLQNGTVQPTHLSAPNGQINLATTKSPGEFLSKLTAAPNINEASFRSYGSAHIASGSTLDVSRTGNGSVSIRGGQLVLEIKSASLTTIDGPSSTAVPSGQDTVVLAPGSAIFSQTSSADQGSNIQIIADRIQLLGPLPPSPITPNTKVTIATLTEGKGNGGRISLKASEDIQAIGVVQLTTDSVDSPPQPSGNAGDIELTSLHGNILLTKGVRQTSTVYSAADRGNTGNIRLSAPHGNIVLERAGLLTQTFDSGKPGEIEVDANNLTMHAGLLSVENSEVGISKPGAITVTLSGTLKMETDPTLTGNFSDSIIATSTVSKSPAADINLTAKDVVLAQKSIINSATFESGLGGNLTIVADTIQITDGSQISSGSTRAPSRGNFDPTITPTGRGGDVTIQALGPTGSVVVDGAGSGIFADTEGTGAGGTINLSAKTLAIQNGGTISASTTGTDPRAIGGSVFVNATDQVMLTNGGTITASSIMKPETPKSGIANAGNIFLNAGNQLEMHDGSSIKTTTESTQANGGNIDIRAIELVRLVNNSEITTSVKGEAGSGGNIFIDPKMVLLQGSNVTAQAVGGAGGNISFVTPLFLADSASIVSASSQRGVSGTVTIQSPTSNLSGAVGQLVSKVSQPQVLLQNRCAALVGGRESTFVLAGRHTLPSEPGDWLSPSAAMEHWIGESPGHASGLMVYNHDSSRPSTAAKKLDETAVVSLRRLTPPGFLVRTFAAEPTGCPS